MRIMYAIEVNNLTKTFRDFSIRDLSLRIEKGCMTGLIGKNGAGKTTLLKSILGLCSTDQGEIRILGKKMAENANDVKEKVALIMDNGYFYSGERLGRMKAYLSSFYKSWDDAIYQKYMRYFGLKEDKKIKELSTGMRAKFNIVLALARHPELLVLDEPSSGLDPVARSEVMEILCDAMSQDDTTVLISTHITSDLDRKADYIVMLDNGAVILDQEKDSLLESHWLIRGGREQLAEYRKQMIYCRETAFGFEGMILGRALPEAGIITEKPMIEDIFKAYAGRKEEA